MKLKHALYEILSEPNGTLSWARVASSICLGAGIVWASKVVLYSHAIPTLNGLIAFFTAPYGVNKAITAVQAFSSNPVNPTASTPPVTPQQ